MKLCACGPFPVRPLPGYQCSKCDRLVVGPPKPNRNLSLNQTPREGARSRALAGVCGRRAADKAALAFRRIAAQQRARAAEQRTPRKTIAEKLRALDDGPLRLDALIRRAEAR